MTARTPDEAPNSTVATAAAFEPERPGGSTRRSGWPRVAVAQLGARHHYAVPGILHRAGMLERFYTDLCADVGFLGMLRRSVPRRLQTTAMRRLFGRVTEGVPAEKIRCFATLGLWRVWARRSVAGTADLLRLHRRADAEFARRVAATGLAGAEVVYTFNQAALEIVRLARSLGVRTIVEQVIAPQAVYQPLLEAERQRWPGWEEATAKPDDWLPSAEREREEWKLADKIICGSDYVRQGIEADRGPADRCEVVPYSAAPAFFGDSTPPATRNKLRVLFVGSVGLRKGAPYLMEAAARLNSKAIEFRVVGRVAVSAAARQRLSRWLDLVGPIPRSSIASEYRQADLFVMPSIAEGSVTVSYEALAGGLPVVTTPNAGTVVRDGKEGFVVPVADSDALADRIERLATEPGLRAAMSAEAKARGREFTWDRYAERLIEAVRCVGGT